MLTVLIALICILVVLYMVLQIGSIVIAWKARKAFKTVLHDMVDEMKTNAPSLFTHDRDPRTKGDDA